MFFLWYINDETGTNNLLIPRKKANYLDHKALYSERGSQSVMKFKASQFQLHLITAYTRFRSVFLNGIFNPQGFPLNSTGIKWTYLISNYRKCSIHVCIHKFYEHARVYIWSKLSYTFLDALIPSTFVYYSSCVPRPTSLWNK